MIELVDNAYMISNWSKYQNNDRLEEIKEKNRERQQRFRDRQKQATLEDKKRNVTRNVTNNVNCSYSYSESNYINNNKSKDSNSDIEIIKRIINYLNKTCGTKYRYSTTNTQNKIRTRLKEGFNEEDFYKVIDTKYKQWSNDKKMCEYLRPETLFGTKFESYLNQKQADFGFNIDDWGNDDY